MTRYYVNRNAQPNGDHEVHTAHCNWLRLAQSVLDLGDHYSCATAVAKAKLTYPKSNGCVHCSPSCHTG